MKRQSSASVAQGGGDHDPPTAAPALKRPAIKFNPPRLKGNPSARLSVPSSASQGGQRKEDSRTGDAEAPRSHEEAAGAPNLLQLSPLSGTVASKTDTAQLKRVAAFKPPQFRAMSAASTKAASAKTRPSAQSSAPTTAAALFSEPPPAAHHKASVSSSNSSDAQAALSVQRAALPPASGKVVTARSPKATESVAHRVDIKKKEATNTLPVPKAAKSHTTIATPTRTAGRASGHAHMPAQVVRTEPKPRPRTPEAIPLPTLPHLPDPPRPSNSEQRDVAQAVQTALLCGLAAGTDGADQCAATWRPSAAAVQATARCLLPSIAPTPPPILAARRVLLTSSLAAAPAATPVATVAPCLDWLSGANSVSRRGTAERFRLAARAAAGPPATAPMTELPEEIPSAAHEHSAPGAVGTGTAERPPTAGLHDQCGAVAAATDFGGALAGGARRVTAAAAGLCWPAADMYAQQDEEFIAICNDVKLQAQELLRPPLRARRPHGDDGRVSCCSGLHSPALDWGLLQGMCSGQ